MITTSSHDVVCKALFEEIFQQFLPIGLAKKLHKSCCRNTTTNKVNLHQLSVIRGSSLDLPTSPRLGIDQGAEYS